MVEVLGVGRLQGEQEEGRVAFLYERLDPVLLLADAGAPAVCKDYCEMHFVVGSRKQFID